MPIKRVSFSIKAESVPRELFFVLESGKTGDLKLMFRRTLYHNPLNKGDPLAGRLVDEQRYSIHTSPDSIHRINTIHQTYRVGEKVEDGYSFTKVVKARTGFVPLFSRRCPNLAKPHYVSKLRSGTTVVPLGAYDPASFTLLYSVFLGPPGKLFRLYSDTRVCVAQHNFSEFSIVVMWNFLSLPSVEFGWQMHVENPHPEEIAKDPEFFAKIDHPLQEFDCLQFHFARLTYLRHQFLCWIEDAATRNLSALAGQFFKHASHTSPDFREHAKNTVIALLFPLPTYVVDEGSYSLEDGRIVAFD